MDGSPRGARVRNHLENLENSIVTSPVTLAEIVSKFLRTRRDPRVAVTAVESNSSIPTIGPELARLA